MLGKKNEIPDIDCAMCQKNVGPTGYSPKKEWNIDGKLCSTCFGTLLGAYGKSPANIADESEKESESIQEQATNSEKCPKCDYSNFEGAKFCSMCGSNLHMKCSKCDNFSPEGSKFCNQCGNPV